MRYIQDLADEICSELEDAKDYSEKALYWKYEGNQTKYRSYLELANDELKHSKVLHDMVVEEITRLKEQGYSAPEKMRSEWERVHAEYVEKYAWIRQILSL